MLTATVIAVLATPAAAGSQACATLTADTPWHPPTVVSGSDELDFEALVEKLAEERVVMIGEVHDRYDHHLNQLELLCRLHERHPDLAIGLEYFQQPFQGPLDAYLDLRIDTPEMLAQTEYYDRWQFDYRLYGPILEFARRRGIPLGGAQRSERDQFEGGEGRGFELERNGASAVSGRARPRPARLSLNACGRYSTSTRKFST